MFALRYIMRVHFLVRLQKIMRAECVDTQSTAMKKLSTDQFCMALTFAITRVKHSGVSLQGEPTRGCSGLSLTSNRAHAAALKLVL